MANRKTVMMMVCVALGGFALLLYLAFREPTRGAALDFHFAGFTRTESNTFASLILSNSGSVSVRPIGIAAQVKYQLDDDWIMPSSPLLLGSGKPISPGKTTRVQLRLLLPDRAWKLGVPYRPWTMKDRLAYRCPRWVRKLLRYSARPSEMAWTPLMNPHEPTQPQHTNP